MAKAKPKSSPAGKTAASGSASTSARAAALAELRVALLAWYKKYQRKLPWRLDHDPYRIWVSEVMLQQTRVAAVLEHYRLFLVAFPTVQALAQAPEEQVLAMWSGLGYYRRARMLHRAARVVAYSLEGVLPSDLQTLRKLPGVGRYTAAAIASIAYGEPAAVVDGNVERVLSRLDGRPRADASAWLRAQQLLDPLHPGDWNQAMMELGATVCTPLNPRCRVCPLLTWCRAPGAVTLKPPAARKRLRATRALIAGSKRIYLAQRPSDVAKMAGMWELPELPAQAAKDLPQAPASQAGGFRSPRSLSFRSPASPAKSCAARACCNCTSVCAAAPAGRVQ
jgi:A/G-specific adenine glycosylase